MNVVQFANAAGCSMSTAADWVGIMEAAASEFGIDTPQRLAGWISQMAHECSHFTRFEERLSYSPQRLTEVWPKRFPTLDRAVKYAWDPEKLANEVYGGRFGNGPYESGDGFKYRGRGPKQLTFKANYEHIGKMLGIDLVGKPELLLVPRIGARSAGAYWQWKNCNPMADRGDVVALTKAVQGGDGGLDKRTELYAKALKALA